MVFLVTALTKGDDIDCLKDPDVLLSIPQSKHYTDKNKVNGGGLVHVNKYKADNFRHLVLRPKAFELVLAHRQRESTDLNDPFGFECVSNDEDASLFPFIPLAFEEVINVKL